MFEMRMTQVNMHFLKLKIENSPFQIAIQKYHSIQQHLNNNLIKAVPKTPIIILFMI